jgi:hypothetical protein
MIEEFEYSGMWWLPEDPEKQVCGILKFTPNKGAVLDLIGSFKDTTETPKIILGISSNGKDITLYECFEIRKRLNYSYGSTTSSFSFYANEVFIGSHFQKTEDIKFKSLSIHYLYLDEWFNVSGFDRENLLNEVVHFSDKKKITINYKLPEPIQAAIDDYKILLEVRATRPALSIVQTEASIKQRTYITIEPLQEKSFDEYLHIIYRIQEFLSLGATEPVYPLAIERITEANKKETEDKVDYPPVEVYYKVSDISKVPKTLIPYNMLFTFKDISDRFEVILKRWFEKADSLKPVYDLYFAVLYNPRIYLEHRFLSLIQAIEAYHRLTMDNFELPENQHKKRIEEILKTVPYEYRSWLEEKLKYSNEKTLRKRLKDLLDNFAELLDSFIPDKESFINKVVEWRNSLTHPKKESKEESEKSEELYNLSQKLKQLIEICLLKELGFTSDNIKTSISRNKRYHQ